MAAATTLCGGIGIIHCSSTPKEQACEVLKVKIYKQGFIRNPVVVSPHHTADVLKKKSQSFCGTLVTHNGKIGGKLVEIVTLRDVDFLEVNQHQTLKLESVMKQSDELLLQNQMSHCKR